MKSLMAKLFSIIFIFSGMIFTQTDTATILPKVIKTSAPVYPAEARRNNLSGVIWLKILVDTFGLPKQVLILKSDNPIFNEPSILAAKQYLFTPATKNGKVIENWVTLPFKFSLHQSGEKRLKQ